MLGRNILERDFRFARENSISLRQFSSKIQVLSDASVRSKLNNGRPVISSVTEVAMKFDGVKRETAKFIVLDKNFDPQ